MNRLMKVRVLKPGEDSSLTGSVSALRFDHPMLKEALETAFGSAADEVIAEVEITNDSIRARFERVR